MIETIITVTAAIVAWELLRRWLLSWANQGPAGSMRERVAGILGGGGPGAVPKGAGGPGAARK